MNATRILDTAPASLEALADWISSLSREEIETVWVQAILHGLTVAEFPPGTIRHITRALFAIRDHPEKPSIPRKASNYAAHPAVRMLSPAAQRTRDGRNSPANIVKLALERAPKPGDWFYAKELFSQPHYSRTIVRKALIDSGMFSQSYAVGVQRGAPLVLTRTAKPV